MPIQPQWKVPLSSLNLRWGFDETAVPKWLLLGLHSSKAMLLDFAAGKIVKSINPRIADVQEDRMQGQSRFFMIQGKSVGRTRIEVRDGKTKALESVLEIDVKRKNKIQIGFHFVEDKSGKRTIHPYEIAEILIGELNSIYEDQANLIFETKSISDIKLDIHLFDFVIESTDPKRKVPTGEARLTPKDVWRKVFATKADRRADFNVYFVPTDEIHSTGDTLIYTDVDNCVIEDGRQLPIYTLAHAVGRMLGCPDTSDMNKMNHLMFWDPGVGKDFFPRSDDFIPRDCVRIMNP